MGICLLAASDMFPEIRTVMELVPFPVEVLFLI